jgi:pSer/pThr/pTyr-binding forkhead associated (FHA) protein
MTSLRPPSKPTRLKITDDKGFEKVVLIDRDHFPLGTRPSAGLEIPAEDGQPVAGRHAVIVREGEGYLIEDRSGSCGTRVNGRPIRRMALKHGDEIRLGSSAFRIRFLVEGTRAADEHEKRVKAMLDILLELHACLDPADVPARAVAGVMHLLSPAWVTFALRVGGSLKVAVGGDARGDLPAAPTMIARHVADTSRASFQREHLCVPVMDHRSRTLLAVVDLGPRDGRPYEAADLELLEVMTAHIGIALVNARRHGLSAASATAS